MSGRSMLEMLTGATCVVGAVILASGTAAPVAAWQTSPDPREALTSTLDQPEAPRVSIADPKLVQRYIESLKESRAGLAGYRWQARTAIRIDDRELIVQFFNVRLDRQGRLQHTLTGHELQNTTLDGPIRRQVLPLDSSDGTANVDAASLPTSGSEQAAALKRLAESYTHPRASDIARVPLVPAPIMSLQPATSTVPDDADGPTETGFRLYDVLRAGDTLEVLLDDDGLQPLHLTAATDLDGAPVEVTAEYSRLPDGTVYRARSVIHAIVEEHPIEVRTETFGFEKRRQAN